MQAQAVPAVIDVESVASNDGEWAASNLRRTPEGRYFLDVANCLKIVEHHPDFRGRYKYNEVLSKVLDRGSVMIEWKLLEFTATIQDRFLPEIPFETVVRSLIVAANRAGVK